MTEYNAASWLLDRHIAEGRGERVAIRYQGSGITYAELQGDVHSAQLALAALGLAPRSRVAMVVNDEPGFMHWFLGAMRAGFVPVPLSTMLTANELASILNDAEAVIVVLSQEYVDHLAVLDESCQYLRQAIVLGDVRISARRLSVAGARALIAAHDASDVAAGATTASDQAFWLYSSGTTGVPKGVIHHHRDLQASADTYARQILRTTPDDRFFSVAKLFFAYGLGNSLTFPFAVGGTTILDPARPTPTGVLATIAAEEPTLLFASPGFVAAMLDADPDDKALASVRAAITAGEALPGDLQRRHSAKFGHPVLDGIGSTEATHIFISNTLERQVPGSSGFPVPGFDLELRDDDNNLVTEPDTPAYLYVRGPSTAAGYHNRPDADAAVFVDGWLKTGDVYVCSADGAWTFLGRNSDMIKAGGIWVSPAEVESVLIDHPSVLEAAVIGARNDDGLETTVAYVVPASGHRIDVDVIEDHCRAHMAAFKRPRRVIVVDDLPKTATGKIQRFQLRDALNA